MKPRIAILTNYPADFNTFTGGVETASAALLEGLKEYQDIFEFHLVSIPQGLSNDVQLMKDGFYFHFLSVPNFLLLRPRLLFKVSKALQELRKISPDLVHCQDNSALAMATALGGYKNLFTIHGVKRHEAKKRTGWARCSTYADMIMEYYIFKKFRSFICISDYSRGIIGNTKVSYVIPNAVRTSFFSIRRNVRDNSPMLLFVGVIAPLKGTLLLVQAHAILRKQFPFLETILCGAVEDKSYFRQIQQESTDGIKFAGLVKENELMQLLSRATVLVLPSNQENLPMVIGEAMASGVPVIATSVGGVPEMVDHGKTGYLCQSNVMDLTKWLENLLSDKQFQHQAGKLAREKALNMYHPTQIGSQTVEIYKKILGGV